MDPKGGFNEQYGREKELDRLAREKKLKIQRGYWTASGIERYLEKWEQEALQRGEKHHG